MNDGFNIPNQMISTDIRDYIVSTHTTQWTPLREEGVDCTGISWMPLRYDDDKKRPISFLLKFDPGASYPYHNHPAGEEILVLSGSCEIEKTAFQAGDYLYTPADFKHSVKSEVGCTMFLIVPEEVEILDYKK